MEQQKFGPKRKLCSPRIVIRWLGYNVILLTKGRRTLVLLINIFISGSSTKIKYYCSQSTGARF